MDTPDDPESRWQKLERLYADMLAKQPERDRETARLMSELDRGLDELRRIRARMDHRDMLERGEDGFDGY